MYKNYIFDLYGTLIDINTNENKPYLWDKMAEYYGFHGAYYTASELKTNYLEIVNAMEKAPSPYEHPEIQLENCFLTLFTLKGVTVSLETAISAAKMFRIISTKYVRLYDNVIETLTELKKRGAKLYVLSNAQHYFTMGELKRLRIDSYFDGILLSSDAKCKKPDSAIYDILFTTYNLNKEESVMIGNDYIADIKSSYEYGIDSIYIHSNLSPEIKTTLYSKYAIMSGQIKSILDPEAYIHRLDNVVHIPPKLEEKDLKKLQIEIL